MKTVLRIATVFALLAFSSIANAASCFWVGGTGTWSTANTASWASATGGTAGTCAATGGVPKQSADTATFDGSSGGGTVTVDSTLNGATLTQITMGAFTGTLDFSVNNPSITLTAVFSISGTATRGLKLGSGTFTLAAVGGNNTPWFAATVTGLTFNAGTSTIALSNPSSGVTTTHLFSGGGLTYNILTVNATNFPNSAFIFAGSNTFSSISVTGNATLVFGQATTTTISSAFSFAGTGSNNVVVLQTSTGSNGLVATISVPSGTVTCAWCAIQGLTFSGGATFVATNSFDLSGNVGITITGPSGAGGGHIIGG